MPSPTLVPSRDLVLLVFAQGVSTRIDAVAWNSHAVRFFGTRIGLTEDAQSPPVGVVIAPYGEQPGVRHIFTRPAEPADYALAQAAEGPAGGGLALLARRCSAVWLVERSGDPDFLALRLAAVLASVMLGPILDTRIPELFGVKTARAKLEALLAAQSH